MHMYAWCLFDCVSNAYIQVNNFSVMSEWFSLFLGWTSIKQQKKRLAQVHNTIYMYYHLRWVSN